jgi:hypothetical protein
MTSFDVNLFSLGSSPINDFIPLAPIISDAPTYIPEEKLEKEKLKKALIPKYYPLIQENRSQEYIKQKEEYKKKNYRGLIIFLSNFLFKKEARHRFREKYIRK